MKKQFLSIVLVVLMMLTLTMPVLAVEMDLEYVASTDFSTTTQGANGWYYQVKKDGTYYDMEYDTASNMLKWRKEDIVSGNYITANLMHPGTGSVSTARVWEAPYSGVVRLVPNGNVCKSAIGGNGITLRIFKNDEVLWEQFLDGTDNVGYTYALKTEVICGDRLYFEIDCGALDHYGATTWDQKVTYVQAAAFSVGGTKIKSSASLKREDKLDCTFYDGEQNVKGNFLAYLAVYDKSGRLRELTAPTTINLDEKDGRSATVSVKMGSSDSYVEWKVSLLVLSSENGRYYQQNLSTSLCLD